MKKIMFLALLVALVSCSDKPRSGEPHPEAPKALQDEKEIDLSLKRGNGDLLEDLYQELVSKDSGLARFEAQREGLVRDKGDSMLAFRKYDDKTQSYFGSAQRMATEIGDSLLRVRIKYLLSTDSLNYERSVSEHRRLVKLIDSNEARISDLKKVLMVTKTLPLMRKFQQDSRPGTSSLEGFLERQRKLMRMTDSLLNK